MRRGVAERGAAEIKRTEYEKEIQRQREQISHMESLFKRQLEGTQNICSQDKVNKKALIGDSVAQIFNENISNLTNMKIATVNTEHHCLLTFRASCRTTFPPVPKRYGNSKVQPLSFNTIILIAKWCEK